MADPMNTQRKPTLSVDFDGVLHSYRSGWMGADVIADDPVPGAIEFLREAVKHFDVCIASTRNNTAEGVAEMRRWLISHGGLDIIESIRFPILKVAALVYMDDRALQFKGEWPSMAELKEFKAWWDPSNG